MINKLVDELNNVKNELEQEIISSNILVSEKLNLLDIHGIWHHNGYICHPFPEWEEENKAAEKASGIAAGKIYHCTIVDDFISRQCQDGYIERYQQVEFKDIVSELEYKAENSPDELFTVVTNRGNFSTATKKRPQEVINKIWEYCVKHKLVGFIMDW